MSGKRDFLSMPAPENYVAGLGRGATGFTTRSDLGPAREGPSEEQMKEMLAKRAAQLGQAAPSAYGAVEKKEEDEDEDRYADPDSEIGLFSSGINHTEDDDEADRIYQEVDEKMDKRRRARREAREQKEREEYERNNPKIQQQFADLKRALGAVSEQEWAALPEVGDMTGRTKRAREARQAASRFYAVPDSVIAAGAQAGQYETSISADSGDGTMTNFASIGAAQKSALQVRLDSAASSAATTPGTQTVSGTSTSVDPRGYITALDKAQTLEAGAPVEDINRARVLLESAVKTNLQNGPGHVALCRLEEVAGKIHTAKKVIARGCELCPHSIVCWVENIRINRDNIHNAKIIAAQAIKLNPKAIDLWKAAIDLEQTVSARKKVTRQALDHNPQSVDLWKILINDTEEIENVRLLFAKAVDTVKLSEELWISYARVSDPDHAQQILNAARKAIPTSWAIWIQACRLQEQLGNNNLLDKLMERAVKALVKENAMLKREEWIAQAEICEEEGAEMTSAAIIKATIGWGLDEDDDRKEIWLQDSRDSIGRGKYSTARAIISHCLRVFPRSRTVWHAAADLEKKHGTTEDLLHLLDRAVADDACPTSESLWLLYAHEAWASGDKDGARQILGRAFRATDSAETVYTRAVQLEVDDKEYEKARGLLEQAREARPTDRVFMKSAVLERQLGNLERSLDLINQGIQTWPASWKLHAIKGQLYESMGKLKEAQEALTVGTRANSKAVSLFILLSRIQERTGLVVKARSTLDRARQNNPKNPEVWCEAVRLERRAGNMAAAQQLMSIALQECPRSGLLWSEKILHLEARTHRKPRALEALKKVESDPQLFVTVARIFWAERKLDRADSWFTKAIVLDADYGDGWAWYYKFLEMHGTEEKKGEVLSRVAQAEPRHGEVWQTVNKDPKNMGKSVEEILKLVVAKLE